MARNTPEYNRAYREKNKEEIRLKDAIRYQKNREKKIQAAKDRIEANPEERKEYEREYNKSDAGKKKSRKASWKRRGVKFENKKEFEEVYEKYLNTEFCDLCNCQLHHGNTGSGKKTMDHDHVTGKFRNILCNHCNIKRR
tara:strand:+ start:104 stop:523 length:420 start_codon:yes stop_codon:yes gene_type:complete